MNEPAADDLRSSDPDSRASRRVFRLAFLALVPLMLIALALWFGSEYRRLGSTEDESARAHMRELLVSELFSSIKDAETGQRGFILTGDDAFLAPFRTGREAANAYFARLRTYPSTPGEEERLARLRRLTDAKFAEMERVIDVRRRQGLAAAALIVSEGRGKQLMDVIRLEAAQARDAEARGLAETLARQDQRTRLTERIIWTVVLLAALAFAAVGILFWRSDRAYASLQRQATEAAARRRAIFDSTLDAIILINPSGSIETINRAATRLFGYNDEQLIRRDISLIADLAPGDGPFLDRIGLGPNGLAMPFRHDIVARRIDGSTVPVEAALGLMPLPDGIHIVAAFRDISEREQAERLKDQFLSTVSHELRTPLTSIVGSLGLLRGGASGELPPDTQRLVVIAENNANRLIRLVNDLLDIEKFESGAMAFDFAPVDLRDSAAKALDTMRGLADKHDVALDLSVGARPVMVRGDADRLIQVMANLLGNAVRFTPPGERVSLVVTTRGGHAEVNVVDRGPGIDDELRARLFTRFAQSLDGRVGASRGTGLGLAISREIVRGHGGGIWYEPAAGGGSIFSFNLPLWNTVADKQSLNGGPRVLICAKGEEASIIAGALGNRSIRSDTIEDPARILGALEQRRYLAVLVDFRCIGSDRMLIQHIRSGAETRRLPIIAIAGGEQDDAADFASLDLVDWIPRPLDPTRLEGAISSIVDRAMQTMPLVLHVDDDTDTLEITAAALEGRARIARVTDIASARAFIAESRPDVVVVDLALPDGSGEDLVADIAGSDQTLPVIIYSAQERNGGFASEVSAVLTKSRRSLPVLVETIIGILDRQEEGADDGR